ncbi:hypothetical protein CDD80_2493 [Ophiocordyceps camponoti-rufipedis]|uniref:EKC/KEOPS complex subunit BUD32 n=1 Tax=Ophiocordyceps camponoti-rufipedis TaxID=2004952 RepID=A0A2C5Z5J0_9HYPO|nr:hypothetical protein CDD80_2493 [Ophiocordyceps camponoti-rufipedis]
MASETRGIDGPSVWQRLVRWFQDWTLALRLRLGTKIMYDDVRKIVRVSASQVIKGPCSEQELEAMEYALKHTSVCLPRIHRTYRRKDGLFIAMDYVQGTQLDHLWPGLDDAARRGVVEKIWRSVKMLHACRPPAELGGVTTASVSGGSVRDGILGVDDTGAVSAGPFMSADDFEDFVKGNGDVEGFPRWPARTGLVHADLTPRNIIVTPDGRVCFIDWEFAGWWPLYWERVKWHFTDFPPTPEWVNLMDEVSGWARGIQEEE